MVYLETNAFIKVVDRKTTTMINLGILVSEDYKSTNVPIDVHDYSVALANEAKTGKNGTYCQDTTNVCYSYHNECLALSSAIWFVQFSFQVNSYQRRP